MLDETKAVLATLARALAGVDASRLTDDEAAEWLATAGEIERLGACLRLVVADRAAQGSSWIEQRHRSPATWVAAVTGTTVGEARSSITASERLAGLEATRQAVARGDLSPTQVKVITRAATADPEREQDLLDAVGDGGSGALRRMARHVEATACASSAETSVEAAGPAVHRFLRMWGVPDGSLRFSGALGAEDGAMLVSAVRSRAAFVADEARAAGLDPEPQSAYDADALVALVTGDRRQATFSGNVGGPMSTAAVVLHVSLEDVRRWSDGGSGEAGRTFGVAGVEVAGTEVTGTGMAGECLEGWIGDAVARLLVEDDDGVVLHTDLGPVVPDEVRSALDERDRMCVVPGCALTLGLRTEFWQVPFRQGGPAELWNLAKLCRFHHRLRTAEGYQLTGGPGGWEWRAPP